MLFLVHCMQPVIHPWCQQSMYAWYIALRTSGI